MKDIDLKATCPYKADVKCDAAINALCDNLCCYHPRYTDDGLNENYKVHRCPYRESTTCSGEDCGMDCCFHPDYDEEDKRTIKKIDRPDLDFDMNEDENSCSLLKDKKNWKNGLAPCVGCERECPVTAGMVEEKEPEMTYDNGVVDGMNKLQEWYNVGKSVGYDKGVAEAYEKGREDMLIECSNSAEDSYLSGYKDGLYGEPPMIEDDELRKVMSEQPAPQKTYIENAGIEALVDDFCVSGKVLCMVEDAKKSLADIRREIYTSSINYNEKRLLAFKLLKIVDMLDSVQHQYTSDEMYRYLGYME